jgi:hypothetical protein
MDNNRKKYSHYLKEMGNPYASLSLFDDDEIQHIVHHPASDKQKHEYLKKLQNPHAYHAIFEDSKNLIVSSDQNQSIKLVNRNKLSKKDFQAQSRRIFSQYIPSHGNKVLRPHHRDFIVRNELRSGEDRYLLIAQLQKYDLSSFGNYKPHFNRERDALTIAKLMEIERSIK